MHPSTLKLIQPSAAFAGSPAIDRFFSSLFPAPRRCRGCGDELGRHASRYCSSKCQADAQGDFYGDDVEDAEFEEVTP